MSAVLPLGIVDYFSGAKAMSKDDAQKWGTELTRLCEGDHNEIATVPGEAVVNLAKDNPGYILHDYFDWNDERVAHRARIERAKYYIRHVCVRVRRPSTGNTEKVRAFVSVKDPDQEKPGYVPLTTALGDDAYREQIIREARLMLRSWTKKYRLFKELGEAVNFIDTFLENE